MKFIGAQRLISNGHEALPSLFCTRFKISKKLGLLM